jgi:ribosomal protein S18 acetylase RimI-like enzyme
MDLGSSQIGLREANTTDAAALLRLHRAVLEERRFFITEPEEFRERVDDKVRLIRDLAREPSSIFLVAHVGEHLAGFLTIRPGPLARMRHAGKLEVMVDGSMRGRGVGRALLGEAMAWAHGNPLVEKVGLSVFADNEPAIALYRSFGFAEEGRRRREYRTWEDRYQDDVLMCCFTAGEPSSAPA